MEIKTGFVEVRARRGRPQIETSEAVYFNGTITKATAFLTGVDFGFTEQGGDHWLGKVNCSVKAVDLPPGGANFTKVEALLGVRDWTGEYDDEYEGVVYFAVVGEP